MCRFLEASEKYFDADAANKMGAVERWCVSSGAGRNRPGPEDV